MTRPGWCPPDIWKTAVDERWDENRTQVVATLINEERERCAKVAEHTYAKDALHFELGTAVAKAIRAGTPCP